MLTGRTACDHDQTVANLSKEEFERDQQLKDTNWFYRGMLDIWRSFLAVSLPDGRRDGRALDAGCGVGGKTPALAAHASSLYGMDYSLDALALCRPAAVWPLTQGSIERLPYQSGSFILVNAFDVLEHIDDDEAVLGECHRVLQSGGAVALALPAFQSLWSEHDVANFHKRRYRRRDLRKKLEKAGFTVTRMTYANFFLFPAVWLARRWEARRRPQADAAVRTRVEDLPRSANAILLVLLRIEAFLLRFIDLPFGVALLCVAEKKGLDPA